jgi:hypothetical protein
VSFCEIHARLITLSPTLILGHLSKDGIPWREPIIRNSGFIQCKLICAEPFTDIHKTLASDQSFGYPPVCNYKSKMLSNESIIMSLAAFTGKLREAFLFWLRNSFGIFLISFANLNNPLQILWCNLQCSYQLLQYSNANKLHFKFS